jgi:hypothetical protein
LRACLLRAALIAATAAAPLSAQDPGAAGAACTFELRLGRPASATADFSRLYDLTDAGVRSSFLMRRASDRVAVTACAAEAVDALARPLGVPAHAPNSIVSLPLSADIAYNSAYPRSTDDGALRGGVGASLRLSTGAVAKWRMLEAALAPELMFEENAQYDIDPYPTTAVSPYAHRWHGRFIDLPQRFGTSSALRLTPGDAWLRVNAGAWRAGLSTETLVWGPARRNPLLLSGAAAGFAHAFIETARPVDAGIGTAELQLFGGRLDESDYFDFDSDNDHRALTGAALAFSPAALDGLSIGAARLHMQQWNDDAGTLLWRSVAGVPSDSAGLPRDTRLFALSMRWAVSNFEIYGEWMRQDAWQHWLRLLNPVDAAQGYTIGAQHIWHSAATSVRLSVELSHLSDALAHRDVGRGIQTFYVSTAVPQGYTHQGQLLGAPIGPGSEAQFVGLDVFWRRGRTSLSVERVRTDDDAYYAVWGPIHGPHGHDTELSLRAQHFTVLGPVTLDAALGYSFRYNRSLLGLDYVNYPDYPYRRDDRVELRVGVQWLEAMTVRF